MKSFETTKIVFSNRENFDLAVDMDNLADDIGYSEMTLVYDKSNTNIRDKFVGVLLTRKINSFVIMN